MHTIIADALHSGRDVSTARQFRGDAAGERRRKGWKRQPDEDVIYPYATGIIREALQHARMDRRFGRTHMVLSLGMGIGV